MRRKNKNLIRVLAVALALLLAGGVVFSALFSALAEASGRDRYEITAAYMPEEQALRVEQRLIYTNRTADRLDAVCFYAAGNLFRRLAAMPYEPGDLAALFPEGYAPGGIELRAVRFAGADVDYGFQGEDESALRVACRLDPGESGVFEFEYFLLLTRCAAFQGVGDTDVRLSAFCFVPGMYDDTYGEFRLNAPLAHTRWLHTGAADYDVTLAIPENWALAATGEETLLKTEDGVSTWSIRAQNVREWAVSFGKRWREEARETASGVRVRALTRARGANRRILDAAVRAVEQCEAWFGPFPVRQLDICQSDYPLGALNFPGAIWVPSALAESGGDALDKALRFCVAQQVFGLDAYAEPSADAWLSDSVSEYAACLLLEADAGRDAFLRAVNRDWVDALQLTIPGGLTVTSDARLFDRYTYDIVVRVRGAVVMHELRLAMGLEPFLAGLRTFREMGADGHTLTEMDFVHAMDAASGGDWEAFLTDWVFNVGDYVNQNIDWFE